MWLKKNLKQHEKVVYKSLVVPDDYKKMVTWVINKFEKFINRGKIVDTTDFKSNIWQ